MSSDDAAAAALAAAKAEKAKAREQKKLKYMRPQQRVEYNRQQQQQRKMELVRDKAKAAVAREHPSMVDLIEKYENDALPYQASNDNHGGDDDDDVVDDNEQTASTTKKRKHQRNDDDNDNSSNGEEVAAANTDSDATVVAAASDDKDLPSYVNRAAFERYKATKAVEIEREIGKLRAALRPDRYYDAQLRYVEKRKLQLEQQVRTDFILQQRDAQLHKRKKIRRSHHNRNKNGQPLMRTMIDDVLHRLERTGATSAVQPHQVKKPSSKPNVTPSPPPAFKHRGPAKFQQRR